MADKAACGFGIVLGLDLARMLNVDVGGQLTLVAPQGMVTPAAVLPRVRQFTVVGIFEAGMQESDTGLALIHMHDAQVLYRLGDGVTGVRRGRSARRQPRPPQRRGGLCADAFAQQTNRHGLCHRHPR